jgi:hypothetical protein
MPKKPAAKPAKKKPAKPQHAHKTGRHNLYKRANLLMAAPEAVGHDDDLLTTAEVADWLRISTTWLEIGRSKNYGPPFERLGPAIIRYRAGSVRAYLKEREYSHTGQYPNKED